MNRRSSPCTVHDTPHRSCVFTLVNRLLNVTHMQVVHPPVRMEDLAVAQLTMFTTVTVPVGTKETTV